MQSTDDSALLRQYAENNSDEAFAVLVARHINLVYSVALRQAGNPDAAEEITQAVFIILARKAASLRHDQALASWLFQTSRLAANNFIRSETRRQRREGEAYMQSVLDETGTEVWSRIAPLLDSAVAGLREKDRQAILLRFYEGRNLREVGLALGASEAAAEKRVNRAVERLRKFFTKRGVSSTTAIIGGAISANSVQTAPVALAKSVTAVAIVKGSIATASTLTLVKGALKIMTWAKIKTAALFGAVFILATGSAVVVTEVLAQSSAASVSSEAVWKQLDQFVLEKEAQATAAATAEGKPMLPELKAIFSAARKHDWRRIDTLWQELRQRAPQFGGTDMNLVGTQWEIVKEVWGAYDNIGNGGLKYPAAFGMDVVNSIPAGSIYFGGTDPGRFLVSSLQKSQVNGDPFFTITQNALADTSYLDYLQSFYGGKIKIPTADDSKNIYEEAKSHTAKPVTVPEINGRLARFIFDKNPDHEFYIEESYPIDWMYPYLEPHGLILKINRQPLSELSDESVQRDHDYWVKYVTPMIGDWLNNDTPVSAVAAFAEKTHLKKDFNGFAGDRRFVENDYSQKMFSKLRSSIAGVFVWRAQHTNDAREKQRMNNEADFAFRQAWALCPDSPEVVYQYVNLLLAENRGTDAFLVAETASQLPDGNQFRASVQQLRRYQKAQ